MVGERKREAALVTVQHPPVTEMLVPEVARIHRRAIYYHAHETECGLSGLPGHSAANHVMVKQCDLELVIHQLLTEALIA